MVSPLFRQERGLSGAGDSRLDAIASSGRAMMRFAIATAAVMLFGSVALAQEMRWSLDPLETPFPCEGTRLSDFGFHVQQPIIITCHGQPALGFDAGKGMEGMSYACGPSAGTDGTILQDPQAIANANGRDLVSVVKRSCTK